MPVLDTYDWETGSDYAEWANVAANPPTADQVSTVAPILGTYSKRLVFDINDNFNALIHDDYNRATATTPILFGVYIRAGNRSVFDVGSFFLQTRNTSTTKSYIGFTFREDGSIDVIRHLFNSLSFEAGVVLGSTAAGVITSGGDHWVSSRFIIDNTVGVAQLAVDGTTLINLSNVDTFAAGGAVGTLWGWECYVSTDNTPGGSEFRIDNFTTADDEAELLPIPTAPPPASSSFLVTGGRRRYRIRRF